MNWYEFINRSQTSPELLTATLTDIECPNCGKKIYRDESVILTCYPPKHTYFCDNCGWKGYA